MTSQKKAVWACLPLRGVIQDALYGLWEKRWEGGRIPPAPFFSSLLEAELALSALRMALRQRQPRPGLVHHSDRGIQYAAHDYTNLLKEHHIRISMSRRGNPYDNAACESFMKTLKYEEVYRTEYRDLADAYTGIGEFIERVYNEKRLHSALGYVPPAEFEQNGGAVQ